MNTVLTTKEFFFNKLVEGELEKRGTKKLNVLELGCGTAPYAPAIIKQFPEVTYVGVEPFLPSYTKAKDRLASLEQATVYNQFGYDGVEGLKPASYDLVVSISVLEHVKQLDRFIALGAKYAKEGALVVHRYDLGHALYPGSLKEKFQIWLGNNVPSVLPEHKFVRYVPVREVTDLFKKHHNAEPFRYTHHQIPNLKKLDSLLRKKELDARPMLDIYQWELDHSDVFATLPLPNREYIFPAVAVWGRHAGG